MKKQVDDDERTKNDKNDKNDKRIRETQTESLSVFAL